MLEMAFHPIWRGHTDFQKLLSFGQCFTKQCQCLLHDSPVVSFFPDWIFISWYFIFQIFLFIQTGPRPILLTCESLLLSGVSSHISASLHRWYDSWFLNGKSYFPLFLVRGRWKPHWIPTTNKKLTETFIFILGLTCTQAHMKKLGCISTLCSSSIKLCGILLESYSIRLSFLSCGNNSLH